MIVRWRISRDKIDYIKDFVETFVEVTFINNTIVISSSNIEGDAFFYDTIEETVEELTCIRIPLSYLKRESLVDFSIGEDSVELSFYNHRMEFMYSIKSAKQKGYSEVLDLMELVMHKDDYVGINTSPLGSMVACSSLMNTKLYCYNNILSIIYERSYIIKKIDSCPNFGVSGKTLKKLIYKCTTIKFINNYIYGELEESGVHVFLNKNITQNLSDIDYILKANIYRKINIDTSSMLAVNSKFNINNTDYLILDFVNRKAILEGDLDITMNLNILDVLSSKKEKEDSVSNDDLLELLNKEIVVDGNSMVNKHGLPKLRIPAWVLKYCIKNNKTSILLSKSFIIITNSGNRIILSRCDI